MAVRPFGLSPEQIRVLGALVEKAATTPETYPLSSNALRTACNQRSSRHPVVEYDDSTVTAAMLALRERELARTVRGAGSRVFKHAHALDRLDLGDAEVAALAILLLRGPQTVGEIKTRAERQHRFASVEDVESALSHLVAGNDSLVARLEREPGQKEARWRHLLDAEDPALAWPKPANERGATLPRPAEQAAPGPEHGATDEPRAATSAAAVRSPHESLARETTARARTLEEITERIEALEESLAEIRRQLDVDEA